MSILGGNNGCASVGVSLVMNATGQFQCIRNGVALGVAVTDIDVALFQAIAILVHSAP